MTAVWSGLRGTIVLWLVWLVLYAHWVPWASSQHPSRPMTSTIMAQTKKRARSADREFVLSTDWGPSHDSLNLTMQADVLGARCRLMDPEPSWTGSNSTEHQQHHVLCIVEPVVSVLPSGALAARHAKKKAGEQEVVTHWVMALLSRLASPWTSVRVTASPTQSYNSSRTTLLENWMDTLLSLLAIGCLVWFVGRVVGWTFVSTAWGQRIKQRLSGAPVHVVLWSVAWSSAALAVVFVGALQRMCVTLTLVAYPLHRWCYRFWRETQPSSPGLQQHERYADIWFFLSLTIVALCFAELFVAPACAGLAVGGLYSTVYSVRHNRRSREAVVVHTGPAHRYWSALEILVPVATMCTILLLVLPPAWFVSHGLNAFVVPLLTWCPLFSVLVLVSHVRFRYRRWSYWSTQLSLLLFMSVVWGCVEYQGLVQFPAVHAWHILFLLLYVYAKLVDLFSAFDMEWLHLTMTLLCCAVVTWYTRQFVF